MAIPPEILRALDDWFFHGLLFMSALVAIGVILEETFELVHFETYRLDPLTGRMVLLQDASH